MPPRFTVILCVHGEKSLLLPLSLQTVLAQSHSDFELFVVGDGASPATIEVARAFARRDSRVRIRDNPKGPRHGENYRDDALREATGELVAHIGYDDLWMPDHLAHLALLLSEVDFGNLILTVVLPNQALHFYGGNLVAETTRRRLLTEGWNFFGPSVAGYRLETYRRLPEGWAPAPEDVWCDLHMWRKFLRLDGIRVGTRFAIQSICLENFYREQMSQEERLAESRVWFDRIMDPERRRELEARCWAGVAERHAAFTVELLDQRDEIEALRLRLHATERNDP